MGNDNRDFYIELDNKSEKFIDESNLWENGPDWQELHLLLIQYCDDNYSFLQKLGAIERQLQKLNDEFKKSIIQVKQ